MRWPAVPASQTAPVRRSSTVTPSCPGSVRTSPAAAARPCWSGQPQLPQSGLGLGLAVGLGVAVEVGVAVRPALVRAAPARFPAAAGEVGPAGAGSGPPPRISATAPTVPTVPTTTSTTSSPTSSGRREDRSGAECIGG